MNGVTVGFDQTAVKRKDPSAPPAAPVPEEAGRSALDVIRLSIEGEISLLEQRGGGAGALTEWVSAPGTSDRTDHLGLPFNRL